MWNEVLLQLPFFFVGKALLTEHGMLAESYLFTFIIWKSTRNPEQHQSCAGAYAFATGKKWIRQAAIVYGVSTATTLLPILGELVLTPNADFGRLQLVGFYLPYLLVPLALAVRMLLVEEPFPQRPRRLVSRKRA